MSPPSTLDAPPSSELHGIIWPWPLQANSDLRKCVGILLRVWHFGQYERLYLLEASGDRDNHAVVIVSLDFWFWLRPWWWKLKRPLTKGVKDRVSRTKSLVKKYTDKENQYRILVDNVGCCRDRIQGWGLAKCFFSGPARTLSTPAEEEAANVNSIDNALYPPHGGLQRDSIQKVPKAGWAWCHC